MTSSAMTLHYSPEMVAQIATGLEDPRAIALRFGLTDEEWDLLRQWPPFLADVEKKKAEFKENGRTFRLMQALYAEELAKRVYTEAMADKTSLALRIEALKWFAKMGDLEPKTSAAAQGGPGFSITINLGGESRPIEYKPAALAPAEDVQAIESLEIDFTQADEAPAPLDDSDESLLFGAQ